MRFLIVLFFSQVVIAADELPKIINHAETETIEKLSSQTLLQQADFIKQKIKIELLKSARKGGTHYFDFLGAPKRTVDDIPDLEGLYGKVSCDKNQSTLFIADDAPPTTLLHEFIHYYQMGQEKRWCELDGRVLESEEKKERAILYHKFEYETLKALYLLQSKLTMNFEDRLIIFEGLNRENKTITSLGFKPLDEKISQKINRELGVMHSQVSYITWLSKTSDDAGSVMQKMEVLNLKGCVESTRGENLLKKVNDCVSARCSLSKINCQKLKENEVSRSESKDILMLLVAAWTKPNFSSTCPVSKLRDEIQDHPQNPTPCWKEWFTQHKKKKELKLEALTPKKVKKLFNVPDLKVDKEISFQKAASPEVFIQKTYCYFVFQKADGFGAVPIDQFAYAKQGALIDFSQIEKYKAWLDTKEGETCSKLVTLFTGQSAARYDSIDRKKKNMLIVNPLASIGGGVDKLKKLIATDVNHERLHLIFSENKSIQKRVKEEWRKLSNDEKSQFKNDHSYFDFSNESTTLKEYFSFSRQDHPNKLF